MCVREAEFCSLRNCDYNHPLLFCPALKGKACDCKKGFKFNQCTGECILEGCCPSKAETTKCVNATNGSKRQNYSGCVPKNCTHFEKFDHSPAIL